MKSTGTAALHRETGSLQGRQGGFPGVSRTQDSEVSVHPLWGKGLQGKCLVRQSHTRVLPPGLLGAFAVLTCMPSPPGRPRVAASPELFPTRAAPHFLPGLVETPREANLPRTSVWEN